MGILLVLVLHLNCNKPNCNWFLLVLLCSSKNYVLFGSRPLKAGTRAAESGAMLEVSKRGGSAAVARGRWLHQNAHSPSTPSLFGTSSNWSMGCHGYESSCLATSSLIGSWYPATLKKLPHAHDAHDAHDFALHVGMLVT